MLFATEGRGTGETRTLIYATCLKRRLGMMIDAVHDADPNVFYVVERYAETSRLMPLAPATGWRSVLKKK